MAKIQFSTGREFEIAFAEFNKQRAMNDKPALTKKAFIELVFKVVFSAPDLLADEDLADVYDFVLSKRQ